MQATLERPAVDFTVDLRSDTPPRCEGPTHPDEKWGHRVDLPAAWVVVFPCGASILMCAGWVDARRGEAIDALCHCNVACGANHKTNELRFIPLD